MAKWIPPIAPCPLDAVCEPVILGDFKHYPKIYEDGIETSISIYDEVFNWSQEIPLIVASVHKFRMYPGVTDDKHKPEEEKENKEEVHKGRKAGKDINFVPLHYSLKTETEQIQKITYDILIIRKGNRKVLNKVSGQTSNNYFNIPDLVERSKVFDPNDIYHSETLILTMFLRIECESHGQVWVTETLVGINPGLIYFEEVKESPSSVEYEDIHKTVLAEVGSGLIISEEEQAEIDEWLKSACKVDTRFNNTVDYCQVLIALEYNDVNDAVNFIRRLSDISKKSIYDILELATKYNMEDLPEACVNFLCDDQNLSQRY